MTRARFVVDLAIERGEPRRQGRHCIVVAAARGDIVDEPVEADLPLAVQGLRDVLQALGDADRVDQHKAGLFLGVRGHLAQLRRRDRARAAPLHLLEIERRLHVAQKDQHLQRFHVGAGGDHVDGDGDARVVVGAELPDQLLRVGAVGLVGDLLREIVALPKTSRTMPTTSSAWWSSLQKISVFGTSLRPGNNSVNRLSR